MILFTLPEVKGDSLFTDSVTLESVRSVATVGVMPSGDFDVPSEPILTGRQNNYEYLNHLDLSDTQQEDLVKLLNSLLSLFSVTLSHTNLT